MLGVQSDKGKVSDKSILALLGSILIAIMTQIITKLNIYITIIIILSVIIAFLILKMLPLLKEIPELENSQENNLKEIQEFKKTQEDLLKEIEQLKENNSLRDIVGIERIIPEKRNILQERGTFLLEASDHIWILGITLVSFWTGNDIFLDYLAQAGRSNVMIQILLLNPESNCISSKANDENIPVDTFKNWINDSISNFINFRQKNSIKRMELYLYDEFPVWHMIIIDRERGRISHYPHGKPGNAVPYYILNAQGKYNLLEPFIMYFEQLKERSKKVI